MHKLQLDGWSAWFVRPTLEQTCSFQCEKKKKKKYRVKKTSEWVWMAVSQASRTPGLGPDSSPPVGGKRPTAMEVAVGQRHLWLNTKIFWYGWKLLLEVFTKMPQQTDPRFKRSRSYNTVSYRGRAGGRAGTACQLSSPLRVLHPKKATSSSVLTMFVHGNPDFLFFSFFFFVNNLSTFAKCSLLWCFCTSPPGSQLPITRHREVPDRLC